MPIFDIQRQARNTALIRKQGQTILEAGVRPARQLATMRPVTDDKIERRKMTIGGAGVAPLKAIGASSPIFSAKIRYEESWIELVQIAEHAPVAERLLRMLKSTDEEIRLRAGMSVEDLAKLMFLRNENRSDLMVMTAILTGELDIKFEDEADQGLKVVYDYDPDHFVNASDWNNPTTGTPLTDLKAGQLLLANDAGEYGIHFWMNDVTYENVVWSDEAKDLLTGSERGQYIPQRTDMNLRLHDPERVEWHVVGTGWRAEGEMARGMSALTKWIPDDVVIMTTSDPYEGEPIVEMFDGLVAVRESFDTLALRQGQQSWARIDDSDTWQWHQVSTRMPRINLPENIVIMDVGT